MFRDSIRQVRLLTLLSVCIPLAACDVPVDFWEDASVNVNAPAGSPTSVTSGTDVNLADAVAEARQVPGFQGIEIPEVQIQISQVGTANMAATISGTLVVTDPSNSSFTAITLPFSSTPIADGSQTTVTPSTADVQALEQVVMAGDSLHIAYTSSVDATPAQFELTAHVEIAALVGT